MRNSNPVAITSPENFAVIDGGSGNVERIAKINLSSLDDVRLEMSKVYRDMRAKRIDPQDGTRLVYVLSQLAKLHEITQVARRLETLELTLSQRPKQQWTN
jgi:hypothetical protein